MLVLSGAMLAPSPQAPAVGDAQAAFRDIGRDIGAPRRSEPVAWAGQAERPVDPLALTAFAPVRGIRESLARTIEAKREIECLALNIYFEARSEPEPGRRAVAHVVLNRVADPRFPTSVCDVVRQGGEQPRHRCQFSWWCDGKSDQPTDWASWKRSKALAREIYWGDSEDPTNGALWYHADYVAPSWGAVLRPVTKIGRHIFYHDPDVRKLQVATAYEVGDAQ